MNKKGIGLMFETIAAAIFLLLLFLLFSFLFDVTGNALISKLTSSQVANSSFFKYDIFSLLDSSINVNNIETDLYTIMLDARENEDYPKIFANAVRRRYTWEFEKKLQFQVYESSDLYMNNIKTKYSKFDDELLSEKSLEESKSVIMNIEVSKKSNKLISSGGKLFDRVFIQLPGNNPEKKVFLVVSRG